MKNISEIGDAENIVNDNINDNDSEIETENNNERKGFDVQVSGAYDNYSLTEEPYQLINAMEEVVIRKAHLTIPYDNEVCHCEKCIYDICAIVLNAIPPRYSTTQKGHLYARISQLNKEESMKISVEIAKAIEQVKNRPAH